MANEGFLELWLARKYTAQEPLPCFRPVSPEDSLFLPCCGQAARSHSRFGGGVNGEIANMTIKASGRAALILATGIWVCAGGPSQAATDGSNAATAAKHHHLKKYAHRKSGNVADKSSTDKNATEASADNSDNSAAIQSSQMPASVANANAELVWPGTPAGNAQAMTDRANNIVQAANPADAQATAAAPVVAPDQLNDVDRALKEGTPAAAPVALASADAPAPTAPPPAAAAGASSASSTWDRTSLIGKIFIGFGALLTMASAARMFMA
jgi:hypothetical protein